MEVAFVSTILFVNALKSSETIVQASSLSLPTAVVVDSVMNPLYELSKSVGPSVNLFQLSVRVNIIFGYVE